jgi:hypothetical protein
MIRNVGDLDRLFRVLGAAGLIACSIFAPLPLTARLLACAAPAVYLLFTAATGLCLGYTLLGRTTCGAPRR